MLSVLHVQPQQTVRIGIVDGPIGIGTVQEVSAESVALSCAFEPAPPDRPRVDLLLALPRPKVMRRLWAQLAALGVGRVMLTNASKVERDYFGTHFLSPEIYRPLLIEGLQQARDTRLPIVSIHRQFRPLVEDELEAIAGDALRLMADPGEGDFRLKAAATREQRILLAVGPEGGWNDFERTMLEARGFQPFSMGSRTLRTDTACIALLTLAHALLNTERV